MIITPDVVLLNFPKTGSTFARHIVEKAYFDQVSPFDKLLFRVGFKERPIFQFFTERIIISDDYQQFYSGYKDQHGLYCQIPEKYRDRPVISIIRNPYERLISAYHYKFWQRAKHPQEIQEKIIKSQFPDYPNLSFEQFVDFTYKVMPLRFKYGATLPDNVGTQSLAFLYFFLRQPFNIIPNLTFDYIEKRGYVSNLAPITYLKTENLNNELFDFLYNQIGWNKKDIEFIQQEEKRNVSVQSKRVEEYFTPALKEFVRQKEKILFALFPEYDQ